MSTRPTREELARQAEVARLEAELLAAKAEAARLKLELLERDLTQAAGAPEGEPEVQAPPVPPPRVAEPPPVAQVANDAPPVDDRANRRTRPPVSPPPVATDRANGSSAAPKRKDSSMVGVPASAGPPPLPADAGAPTDRSVGAPVSAGGLGEQAKAWTPTVDRPLAPAIDAASVETVVIKARAEKPTAKKHTAKPADEQAAAPKRDPVKATPAEAPSPPAIAAERDLPLAVVHSSRLHEEPNNRARSVVPAEVELTAPATAEPPVRELRLSRRLFQQMGAWTASMVVHLVCLIVLAMTMLPALLQPDPPQLEALLTRDEELVTQELEEPITPATEVTMNTVSSVMPVGHKSSMDGAVGQPTFDRAIADSLDGPKVNVGDVSIYSIKARDLGVDVPEGAPGDPQAIVDNYDQAFDRITQEIRMMLMKNKVLVAWLFDQSESMKDDQKEIRARIERVYSELGLIDQAKGDALLTAVASYGEKWRMHTRKPTYELDQIRAAMDEIPVDESGLEMTCDAVGATVTALQPVAIQGRRQLALILVSDESGDQRTNVSKLEDAIAAAKAARTRIYILGREAVFGYPYAHMRWHHPRVGTRWLPIDRGPETPFVEQLQTEGFQRRYDAHCSGFGPYEHCRMARETGGIFFMLPSLETDLVRGEKRRYELEAMRPYMPDLNARNEYAFERDKSELRSTIWQVINDLNPYRPEIAKHIDLRQQFSADPAAFARQVNEEQAKAAVYVTYLDAAEKAMEKLKSRRDNEPYPRWRANYDLIMAQILAYKVHVYEYGAYLEEFKKNPKQVPLTKAPNLRLGRWDLRHRQKTVTGDLTKAYIERARELFNQIIAEHAGTPWAARAEWELKRGFGVELVEVYHGPPNPNPPPSGPPVKIPKL